MHQSTVTQFGLVALVIALALAGFTAFAFSRVSKDIRMQVEAVSTAQFQSTRDAEAMQVHRLLEETKEGRNTFDTVMDQDVIEVITRIEQVGTDAGVPVQISNAVPETIAKTPISASTLTIVVQTTGTFAQVTKVVSLLSALPLAASLEDVVMENSGQNWNMSARMRVHTTSNISQ